jgi:hypothetical protein
MDVTFDQRSAGRRQLVRHVVTRLRAEGLLDRAWTVASVPDFVVAAVNAAVTQALFVLARVGTPPAVRQSTHRAYPTTELLQDREHRSCGASHSFGPELPR